MIAFVGFGPELARPAEWAWEARLFQELMAVTSHAEKLGARTGVPRGNITAELVNREVEFPDQTYMVLLEIFAEYSSHHQCS